MASQVQPDSNAPINYLTVLPRWILDKCKLFLTYLRAVRPIDAGRIAQLLYFYFHVILVWLLSIGTGLRFEMPNERFYQGLEPVKIHEYSYRNILTRPLRFLPKFYDQPDIPQA